MKKALLPVIIGVLLMLTPLMATAASFTGSVQGFMCVTQGKVCPIGQEDPMAAVENVFVLLVDAATGEYYFVPNVDRVILARHINERIRIEGTLNEKMKSIDATDIYVGNMKVWSANMEDDLYKGLFGTGSFMH